MDGNERGTHEPRWLRGWSLYVQATKRPLLTFTCAALAVALLAKAVWRSKGFSRRFPRALALSR
jgi:hypothetical protein